MAERLIDLGHDFWNIRGNLRIGRVVNVGTQCSLPIPGLLRRLPQISFHPTLGHALQNRPAAAQDFRAWALRIANEWRDTRTVCAAHSATLAITPGSFPDHIRRALSRVEPVLTRFETTRA